MRWVPLTFYALLALVTVAAAMALGGEPGARAQIVSAEGGFTLTNSRDGQPVFTASGIGPGDSASGTVELAVAGEAAELTLDRGDLADTPGGGGGALSAALTLRVRELTGTPATVYSGPLATMPPQDLGRIEPGQTRRFEFVATLPEAGPGVDQNALQGASTSVGYLWTASETGEGEPEEPEEPGPEDPGPEGPGGGPPGGQPPDGGTQPTPPGTQSDPFDFAVTKVARKLRRGRLVIWTTCDRPCAVTVRGRLRARDDDDRRAARIRYRRPALVAGPQRLRIKLPRKLRRWLLADPSHERVRAKLTLLASDAAGDRNRVKRTLKLRSAR